MDNAIGTALSSPRAPNVSHPSPAKYFGVLDDSPDAGPSYERSAAPPRSLPQVARGQLLHAIPNLSFPSFGSGPAGSRVAPIDVDNGPEPPVSEQVHGTVLNSDPVSACMARVLEILPDVEPDHLTHLVTGAVSTHGSGVLEHVLHVLFEDSKYPKIDAKGKGKRKYADDGDNDAQAGSSKRPKVDFGYGDLSRAFKGGPDYPDLALVWNLSHHDMYTFKSEAGTSTGRLPFPPEAVSERIS